MSGSRLHCVEKHLQPVCHPAECHLAEPGLRENKTFCVNDNLPRQVELKGDVCKRGIRVDRLVGLTVRQIHLKK